MLVIGVLSFVIVRKKEEPDASDLYLFVLDRKILMFVSETQILHSTSK